MSRRFEPPCFGLIARAPLRFFLVGVLFAGLLPGAVGQDAPVIPTITWTAPAAINYGRALNSTQLDAKASVPGTFSYSPAAGTVLDAGPQTLNVTFTPTDSVDYTTATASVTLTVNQKTPVIIWPTPAPITYGQALGPGRMDASTTTAGTFVYSPASGTILAAGVQTLSVTFTPTNTTDYTTATASVTLTVNQKTPVIIWPKPAPITYGQPLGPGRLDASTITAGTFVYSPASGTILAAGVQTLSVTFTPTNTTDYTTATASVTLTVNQKTPVIIWPKPAPITYGQPLGSGRLDASTITAGTFVYSPASGTILAAGVQTLSVTFTPTNTTDYTTATASVTLTVNQKTPVIIWPTPAPITYGQALGPGRMDASTTTAGTFVYSPASGTILAAGVQTLLVTFNPSDSVDYTTATTSVPLTVNQATPTVRWTAPAAILYGTALSSSQLDATASVPGTFAYAPAAGTVLTAGSQTLSVTFTPTDSTDYTTATGSVSLTVNQATPTITWPPPASIASGTPLSLAQLDATASMPGTFDYAPAAGSVLSVGSQTLGATFTPTDTADYATATASVTLTVTNSPGTIVPHTIQITDDADDGFYNNHDGTGWHIDPQAGGADWVGSWGGQTLAYLAGYRFPATGINSGDTIQSAYLELWSSDGFAASSVCGSAPCPGTTSTYSVYGVAQDDGPPFSGEAGNTPLDVPYTNSYNSYTATGPGDDTGSCQGNNNGQNTCTHIIDVTNLVQEVTSRPGWTNASAMRFVLLSADPTGPNEYAGYEDSSANPARAAALVVNPPQPTIVSSGAWGTGASGTYPTSYQVGPYVYPGASTLLLFLGDYYNFYGQAIDQPTVTDSCGNTWNILAGPTDWAGIIYDMRSTVYYVQSPAPCPGGDTITVTADYQEPIFLHFLGVAGSDPTQTPVVSAITSPDPGVYTTSAESNAITMPGAGLLVSWIFGDSDALHTFTPQSGFITDVNSTPNYLTAVSENVSTGGQYQSQFTIGPCSDGWQVVIIGLAPPS